MKSVSDKMNLVFSVLRTERLTKKEARFVQMGVGINPLPVLRRWVKRDKRNKLVDVCVVVNPSILPPRKKKVKG